MRTIPTDLSVTGASAIMRHDGFTLEAGSFEKIKHKVRVELYFPAATAGVAEKAMLPAVTLVIAAFRTKVGLFGAPGIVLGVIESGGPPYAEDVNTKPYLVYPITVNVLEANSQTYTLT